MSASKVLFDVANLETEKLISVTTTINSPTKAVLDMSGFIDEEIVVVGDRKTPDGWEDCSVDYLHIDNHHLVDETLAGLIPESNYRRKNLGYVRAIKRGATILYDLDDDNVPLSNWCVPAFGAHLECVQSDRGYVNIYSLFTDQKIWPRGMPIRLINAPTTNLKGDTLTTEETKIGVWQGLADEEPDVDALYRLILNDRCTFEKRAPVALNTGTICPYNSQNTFFRKEVFPLLYLPTNVGFRFTDILRGLLGQVVLWRFGYKVAFAESMIFHDRNDHDYFVDFKDELDCYLHTEQAVEIARRVMERDFSNMADALVAIYTALVEEKILPTEELKILEAFQNAIV